MVAKKHHAPPLNPPLQVISLRQTTHAKKITTTWDTTHTHKRSKARHSGTTRNVQTHENADKQHSKQTDTY